MVWIAVLVDGFDMPGGRDEIDLKKIVDGKTIPMTERRMAATSKVSTSSANRSSGATCYGYVVCLSISVHILEWVSLQLGSDMGQLYRAIALQLVKSLLGYLWFPEERRKQ